MIKKLTKENTNKYIAKMIYQADDFLFRFTFGKEQTAIKKIENLLKLNDNSFSYKYMHTMHIDGRDVGVTNFFDPQKIDKKLENKDLMSIFNSFEQIILFFKYLFLKPLEDKTEIDGIYIQILSVNPEFRGQGMGTKLINYVYEYAKNNGYKSVWLDVSMTNPKAKKLYEKLGFKMISSKKLLPFDDKSGIYRMRKD